MTSGAANASRQADIATLGRTTSLGSLRNTETEQQHSLGDLHNAKLSAFTASKAC